MSLSLKTDAFAPAMEIPRKFTCEGADVSPAFSWDGVPESAKSLVLIADDPDAPGGTFTHWLVYNIPSGRRDLPEGVEKSEHVPAGGFQGRNDFRRVGYGGPCPPPGKPHRYFFRLFALDAKPDLKPGIVRKELEQAMQGHVISQAEVMGRFKR